MIVGARTRPGCFAQFFWWIPQFIPARSVEITGFYWAIWKVRKKS